MQAHCNAHENMEREREREVRMGIKMRRKIKPNAKLHYAWGWRIVLHKNAIVVFLFHAIVCVLRCTFIAHKNDFKSHFSEKKVHFVLPRVMLIILWMIAVLSFSRASIVLNIFISFDS